MPNPKRRWMTSVLKEAAKAKITLPWARTGDRTTRIMRSAQKIQPNQDAARA